MDYLLGTGGRGNRFTLARGAVGIVPFADPLEASSLFNFPRSGLMSSYQTLEGLAGCLFQKLELRCLPTYAVPKQ